MKRFPNVAKMMLLSAVLFFSCEAEKIADPVKAETPENTVADHETTPDPPPPADPVVGKTYNVVDANRCPFNDQQPTSNLWWPDVEEDFLNPETYFSSSEAHKMLFTEYDDGTAHLTGSTTMGSCVVDLNVWFIDRKEWSEWQAAGGEFKREGCAGEAADENQMHFYVIDSERSTFSTNGGDCLGEGEYTLEQRPDPSNPDMPNFGAHVGPGGANYDSNKNAYGLSTWAYIINADGDRMWMMDFNFLLYDGVCKVIDADRCPNQETQTIANLWWPESPDDFNSPSTYFSSDDENGLTFAQYNDGTARIQGSTAMGSCVVEVDVWLKDRRSWDEWQAMGGEFKREGCAGNEADETQMNFYVIDSERSTFKATGGDCLGEGMFTLEQRPDPLDSGIPNFGAHVGPGGALLDSNIGAPGLSTWAYIVNSDMERMWIMDFNFRLDCPAIIRTD